MLICYKKGHSFNFRGKNTKELVTNTRINFRSHSTTEAVVGVGNTTSRPTSPVPNAPADVAIEIDEDPPDAADSEPLVCC